MTNKSKINLYQIDMMKHAIGFKRNKVKRGKYIAWRNYFCLYKPGDDWEQLVDMGLAAKRKSADSEAIYYHVTEEGLKLLSNVLEIKIIEDEE